MLSLGSEKAARRPVLWVVITLLQPGVRNGPTLAKTHLLPSPRETPDSHPTLPPGSCPSGSH